MTAKTDDEILRLRAAARRYIASRAELGEKVSAADAVVAVVTREKEERDARIRATAARLLADANASVAATKAKPRPKPEAFDATRPEPFVFIGGRVVWK